MARREIVLDLLKFYSDQLRGGFDNRWRYFLRLHELFNRGVGPLEVRGYLPGALVSFQRNGYYKLFNVNPFNAAWIVGKHFTPWTGQTFDPISNEKLQEFTGGVETGSVPTFFVRELQSA